MKRLLIAVIAISGTLLLIKPTQGVDPASFNLSEGALISAQGSSDPDIYIVNAQGFKRLFLNPVIFGFYGHLGGFANVRSVSPSTRDAFTTSGLFRNCETNDQKVWAVEVTGEDFGILHHVNISGSDAVAQDPDFFKKVFCINTREEFWYPKSTQSYTHLSQVPVYSRNTTPLPTVIVTPTPTTSSSITPTPSPTPTPIPTTVSVKEFGAKGDGVSDDYQAIKAAAVFLCQHPGYTLVYPPGTYLIQQHRIDGGPNANGITDIEYNGCSNTTIEGYGARIEVLGAFKRTADYVSLDVPRSYKNQVVPMRILNTSGMIIKGFELDGNVQDMTRDEGVASARNHGLQTSNVKYLTLQDMYIHHFAGDGVYLGASTVNADRNITLKNVRATHNARNNLSIIQARDVAVSDSEFSNAGRTGAYGTHAPRAGVDVEPNVKPPTVDVKTGNISFINTTFTENLGMQMVSGAHGTVENITIDRSIIQALGEDTYAYAFSVNPTNARVSNSTFTVGPRHIIFAGVNRQVSELMQIVFENNIFNLSSGGDLLGQPSELIKVYFINNRVTVTPTAPDTRYIRLYGLASVTGNIFTFHAAGHVASDTEQVAVSYEGTRSISGNSYSTNLSGAKFFSILYPSGVTTFGEVFSGNVVAR